MDQTCLCKRYDIEFVNNKVVIRMIPWETDIYEDLKRNAANSWLIDINREEAKRGRPGKNKLRTYATFITDWGYESYLSLIEDGRKRNLITKLRILEYVLYGLNQVVLKEAKIFPLICVYVYVVILNM